MTDPFMLDQREAELALKRLEASVADWRRLRDACGCASSIGQGGWTEAMESRLLGLDGSIRNGIRDVKWTLAELEETLGLLAEHQGNFAESEDLNSRRGFLETARESLARLELEFSLPPQPLGTDAQQVEEDVGSVESADERPESELQEQPCIGQSQTASGKSVSWKIHAQSSDGTVRIFDRSVWLSAKPQLRRFPAMLIKYRLWISIAVAVVLFVIVLLVLSVFKAKRVQASTDTTDASTTPK